MWHLKKSEDCHLHYKYNAIAHRLVFVIHSSLKETFSTIFHLHYIKSLCGVGLYSLETALWNIEFTHYIRCFKTVWLVITLRENPGSIPNQNTHYTDWTFCGLPQYLQNSGTARQVMPRPVASTITFSLHAAPFVILMELLINQKQK